MPEAKNTSQIETRIEDLFNRAYRFAQSMHRSDLVGDIGKLWQALTIERADSLADYFKNPALRRAYIGYYAPLYAAKIALLLRQMVLEGHIKADASSGGPRVLDLGSGPLVGVMAAHLAFGQISQASAVDREIGPMRHGYDFLKTIWPVETLKQIELLRANLTGPEYYWKPRQAPDLIIMSHVLNEFGAGRRFLEPKLKLIASALRMLAKDGRMLIVEPANKINTRELMSLRDALVEEGSAAIFAPCTGALHCPLLRTSTSWCHGELAWKRPAICEQVDQKIGFDKSYLKYSYLLIGNTPQKAASDENWRVVSGPMSDRGTLRRYVCTPEGLLTLAQDERERNKPLRDFYRGELIAKSSLPKDLVKVVKES
jgi:hypothetical protein